MKKIAIVLVILWMGVIFYNSSRTGIDSNTVSYKITNTIRTEKNALENKGHEVSAKKYSKLPTTKKDEKINLFIRKNAHAFEYFVLAIFTANCLFVFFGLKGKRAVVYIAFICLLYAVTDEFHQMFVPGRTSLVSDVCIDFCGSILGMIIYYFFYYITAKYRKQYLNENKS